MFVRFKKNNQALVNFYHFEGITCSGCKKSVSEKFMAIPHVLNVAMSNDFATVMIVSTKEIDIKTLSQEISYDALYSIKKADS